MEVISPTRAILDSARFATEANIFIPRWGIMSSRDQDGNPEIYHLDGFVVTITDRGALLEPQTATNLTPTQ